MRFQRLGVCHRNILFRKLTAEFLEEFIRHKRDLFSTQTIKVQDFVKSVSKFRRKRGTDAPSAVDRALSAVKSDGSLFVVSCTRIGRHQQEDISEIHGLAA